MAYRSFVLKDREVLVVKPVAKDVPRELPSLDPLNELVEVVATGVTWGDRAIVGFLGRMDRAERSPAVGRGRRDKIGCQQVSAQTRGGVTCTYARSLGRCARPAAGVRERIWRTRLESGQADRCRGRADRGSGPRQRTRCGG